MCAFTGGTLMPFALAECTADGDRVVNVIQPLRVGMGAFRGRDGVDARDNSMNNMRNHLLETVEDDSGVVTREYDIRPDSGGPGQGRGGVAGTCTIEILRDGGTIYELGMERMRFPAWGVAGGKSGATFRIVCNLGRTDEQEIGKIDQIPVDAGDTITILLPGAGGYRDPFLRDPRAVLRDVEFGFVSCEGARRNYGVVITEEGLDEAATEELRRSRVKDNVRAEFDFGPERKVWDSVFDDATMNELNRRLFEVPISVPQETRRRIFEQVVPGLPASGEGKSLAPVLADPDAVRERLPPWTRCSARPPTGRRNSGQRSVRFHKGKQRVARHSVLRGMARLVWWLRTAPVTGNGWGSFERRALRRHR